MFGEKLAKLRESRLLTQEQFGKRIGVSKQTVSNWENEYVLPSVEKLIRIANFFKVSADYLLGLDDTATTEDRVIIDVTGLNNKEIIHLTLLVDDLRSK